MSNPYEHPSANDPAQGQPPYGAPQQQPGTPPQYQAPQYGAPGQQPDYGFQMPQDGPRNFQDVMPQGGLSGMFKVQGLPTELQVSYWIWLIGGALGVIFGLLGLIGGVAIMASMGGAGYGALIFVFVLIAIALAAAQIILAMKMKEGKQWARLTLTILAVISLVLSFAGAANAGGAGANWLGFVISAVATVLMWLPNSQAWFQRVSGRA